MTAIDPVFCSAMVACTSVRPRVSKPYADRPQKVYEAGVKRTRKSFGQCFPVR